MRIIIVAFIVSDKQIIVFRRVFAQKSRQSDTRQICFRLLNCAPHQLGDNFVKVPETSRHGPVHRHKFELRRIVPKEKLNCVRTGWQHCPIKLAETGGRPALFLF
jgi:hypothetical protein